MRLGPPIRRAALLASLAAAACARPAVTRESGDSASGASTGAATGAATAAATVPMPSARPEAAPAIAPAAGARSAVDSLERVARALARTTGCSTADDCRTAPLGVAACGGPRDFVVYCARSTDTVALFRALEALARAERASNEQGGMMGTCQVRMPPVPGLVAGRCSGGTRTGNGGPQ